MNKNQFRKIIEIRQRTECRATLSGLSIINWYLPEGTTLVYDVGTNGHTLIHAGLVDDILTAGLTEKDATTLQELGWVIDGEYLARFT